MKSEHTLLSPADLRPATQLCAQVLEQLNRILLGQEELHRMVLIGLLSRGHILLEGVPGLGKTALVKAISQIFQLEFKRIQFTPDLMPSDILGTHILQQDVDGQREMVFRPGPVFANLILADEINRASPKTQSAMLETMQERSVTLLGETRQLPWPSFVLASQNPIELEGTYPLPEAQLDRFLFRLLVSGLDTEVLTQIITTRRRGEPPPPTWQLSKEDLKLVFGVVDRVFLPTPVANYISRLVTATHSHAAEAPEAVKRYVTYGASPRAAIALAEAARANALIKGRPTVGFEDVRPIVSAVLNHRIILNYKARFENVDAVKVVEELLTSVAEVDMGLPEDIEIVPSAEE